MARCAFLTFGCKTNQYDTQAVRDALAKLGWEEACPSEGAELYIVNTCCVTQESHGKGLQAIRRIAREHPGARIVVTGCSAEVDAATLRQLPGVVCVVGNEGKARLAELVAGSFSSAASCRAEPRAWDDAGCWPGISRFAGHTRAFVKIEDGCNESCSYCIVPRVRGPVRSRPPEAVVEEVERLVGNGYPEIVLTGIHLGAYGLDVGGSWALAPLVERIAAIPGLRRLRLSSLELGEVSDDVVALVASCPILCPHFHIPLQSGDDDILRAMNRRYSAADFLRRLDVIRARIPEPAITTDIMVGFPGETDEQFRRTIAVARQAAFSRIHVFPYSDRPGTPAAAMRGKVPRPVVKARRQEMLAVASELMAAYHRRFIGRTVQPLVESQRDRRTGLLVGYTERYVRTLFPGPDALRSTIVPVRIASATPAGVRGELA